MAELKHWLPELQQRLRELADLPAVWVGFDGYVDRIQRIVGSRDGEAVRYVETLTDFSARVARLAGRSGQMELQPRVQKLGGNAPIMALALGRLGASVRCAGTMGVDGHVDPNFEPLRQFATLDLLGPPAQTTALEFEDGKLILSDLSPFAYLDWEAFKQRVDFPAVKNALTQTRLVALVGLSNLPHAQDLVAGMLTEGIPEGDPQEFFFDLADPGRWSPAKLKALLEVIAGFEKKGQVSLGVNENEARQLYRAFIGPDEAKTTEELAEALFPHLGLTRLMVHPVASSCVVTAAGLVTLPGRLVKAPRLLTGAGDNLNAGFCLGLALGWELPACLLLGMATSGAYVSDGQSPDLAGLQAYLAQWATELPA